MLRLMLGQVRNNAGSGARADPAFVCLTVREKVKVPMNKRES